MYIRSKVAKLMSLLCLFAHLCCKVWQKSKWNRWDSLIAVIKKIRFIVKTVNIVQLQKNPYDHKQRN